MVARDLIQNGAFICPVGSPGQETSIPSPTEQDHAAIEKRADLRDKNEFASLGGKRKGLSFVATPDPPEVPDIIEGHKPSSSSRDFTSNCRLHYTTNLPLVKAGAAAKLPQRATDRVGKAHKIQRFHALVTDIGALVE